MKANWKILVTIGCALAVVGASVAAAVLLFVLSWSGFFTKPSDVPGIYEAVFPAGTDTLAISPKGTYEQTFTDPAGKITRNLGIWTWYGKPDAVEFDNFIRHIDERGAFVLAPPTIAGSVSQAHLETDLSGPRRLEFSVNNVFEYKKK